MSATDKMVEHTYKVIEHSNGLVNAMVDQETGLRGFAIGGQDDYLEPYINGKIMFQEHLITVKQLTSDNPVQQKRFDAVAKDAASWESYAEKLIALRQNIREGERSNQSLKKLIASGIGKQKMDGIRSEIALGKYGQNGDDILEAIINMETGLRGFMLNRKTEFLAPYINGKDIISNLLPSIQGTKLASDINGWINNYAEKAIAMVHDADQFKGMDNLYLELSQKKGKLYMDGLREKIATIVGVEKELMIERQNAAEESASLANNVILFGGLLTILLSFGFGMLISNSITTPIGRAVDAAKRLAQGDLTIQIEHGGKNEVGVLLTALQTTADSLQKIIGNMACASERLNNASNHLSSTTSSTSEGVREQLNITDQVVVAMNQMSISVQEVAQNAVQAAQFANEANSEAQTGIQVVQDTVESINTLEKEISNTSARLGGLAQETENIGSILDVIRSIADQTNLLALNAAIEAARAGEQGRGFAVVADEVRGLAKRTQDSTSEIQVLIEHLQQGTREVVSSMKISNDFVQSSVEKVGKSGDTFTVITDVIAKINDMNTQNANASEEQSVTAEQINQNMVEVNKISQQSAADAENTVESSNDLATLSTTLQGIVGQFKM
ncbi:CHASE3 domain-containing protein [uncultured Photobacterium sp.]|uniref:CHASE3 domain-containing protein n=1 Tax=uncultured Photobacterium sp. TaxID=173973 RepID=UPI0026027455|nr:CHASE3 domain-containing protein [uncultured Photobacterium sp.]